MIENCPHVYFVGNQDRYETRLLKGVYFFQVSRTQKLINKKQKLLFFLLSWLFVGSEGQSVRLVCIPNFSETGIAVVVSFCILNFWHGEYVGINLEDGVSAYIDILLSDLGEGLEFIGNTPIVLNACISHAG